MPENEQSLDAAIHCREELKREWMAVDKKKVYKAYGIDSTGVYHRLAGMDMLDCYSDVIAVLTHCLREEVIG